MRNSLKLPNARGILSDYFPGRSGYFSHPRGELKSRIAFSAAHIVCNPLANIDPITQADIDWESTLAFRRYLWSLGLSVAEATDTAQRGSGLDWKNAKELIIRSSAEAKAVKGRIACGAGTDQLQPGRKITIKDVQSAYEEQCELIEKNGSQIVLMASSALADCAQSPEDYERVYGNVLKQVKQPAIIHWLGEMYNPSFSRYWGFKDLDNAMEVCLNIIWDNQEKVDGIMISLLDKDREMEMRGLLPKGIRMYTGDNHHYPELILGDSSGYSDAMLGVFNAIAPAAAAAMKALDENDTQLYHRIMESTVPVSRHIFQNPTCSYKTGIVFMAYLNGFQSHFKMIGGAESSRSIIHLAELFVLADQAGLLVDPELAAERMKLVLKLSGI